MANSILVLIGLLLVLINAFFVAAEFGMVRLRHTRVAMIKEEFPWRGNLLAKVHQKLDAYLSACQLGITLASLGLGWIGEPAFAELLKPLFHWLQFKPALAELTSFIAAFSFISFLHIVVGELMPKSLAIRQSELISLWTAPLLYFFYWLMYPIIWFLNSCSNILLKTLKLDETHPDEQFHSSEEIKLILRGSQLHGELSQQESRILVQTLELDELCVKDIMRSYDDMIMLKSEIMSDELIEILSRYRYSRYPVYENSVDNIVGLLHVKDLQPLLHQTKTNTLLSLKEVVRPAPRISARLPVLVLLRQFQEGMPHFALVRSHRDDIIGFVTLDNLLHLVIGVIKDEFHKTQDAWVKHEDGTITIKGDCSLIALEKILGHELTLEVEDDEELATIAGLILHKLGFVPKEGEIIHFDEFTAIVEHMQGARIRQVRIRPVY